ncbi:MAG: T9SS type A sorting domain-containing protein [Saprospiraceae bacterium]|nr:T9SS type A sorting domain-containing protein [Saprospiraceae bacterium]
MICLPPLDFLLLDANGQVVLDNTLDSVGATLTYRLEFDLLGLDTCRQIITLLDTSKPVIDYPSMDTVSCVLPVDSFPHLSEGDVVDCSDVRITQIGDSELDLIGCSDPVIYAKYYRLWQIEDGSGNITLFRDTICAARADLADIVFPASIVADTFLLCESFDTSVAATGWPLLDTIPVTGANPNCNLWVFYRDSVMTLNCPSNRKVLRRWTLMDDCGGMPGILEYTQVIEIKDTVAPSAILPDTLYASTGLAGCYGDFTAPLPSMLRDNCADSADVGIEIIWLEGPQLAGPDRRFTSVPPGTHRIEYTFRDGCGNFSRDTIILIMEDNTPPAVVCKNLTFQFNEGYNEIVAPASMFDNGSMDLCGGPVYLKVRRMDVPASSCTTLDNPGYQFSDNIRFCCTDVDTTDDLSQPIMVLLRGYDIYPGAGPIPDDTLSGHYAQCMAMVTILDKAAPTISCGVADTIDCSEYPLLAGLREPTVSDNCADPTLTLISTNTAELDACHTGTIYRVWEASDISGNSARCTQIIVVENNDPFDANNPDHLVWPGDTVLYGCGTAYDTTITGSPHIYYDGCSQIAYRYYDEVYESITGVCLKILRYWKVLDWCQFEGSEYDPFDPNVPGTWRHLQVIKIMDSIPPRWVSPIADVTVNIEDGCGPVHASLAAIDADDCTSSIRYRYTIDYGNNHTIDTTGKTNRIEGTFPMGESLVTLYADDGCGNIIDTSFIVTARDNKRPTPGLESLITTLMSPAGMIQVPAYKFNKSSFDNCTPDEDLLYAYSDDPADSLRTFTCADLGLQLVTIYVFDGSGNYDFAIDVPLTIQDNNNACPGPTPSGDQGEISIVGKITTSAGKAVDQTDVYMRDEAASEHPVSTNILGQYVFNKVPVNHNYQIKPVKSINPLNGVSTLDVVKIMKHILGVDKLNDPYQLLAADVNFSGQVNGGDVIDLRKIVLGLTEFKDQRSWIFVNKNYQFKNELNPFEENYPQSYTIQQAAADMQVNFIGVKMGDVDNTAIVGQLAQAEIRSNPVLPIYFNAPFLEAGKDYQIRLTADALQQVWGGQFALWLDPTVAAIVEVQADGVLKSGTMNDRALQDGLIKYSFVQQKPAGVDQGEVLLTLTIRAQQTTNLEGHLQFVNQELAAEIYQQDQTSELVLVPGQPGTEGMRLAQNRPNPFADQTIIDYFLPQSANVQLTVVDLAGKQVLNRQLDGNKGLNSVVIAGSDLPQQGMYIYMIRTNTGLLQNKMIYLH